MSKLKTFSQDLPSSFRFAEANSISPSQIIKLRESVGWTGDSEERWKKCLDSNLASICVINEDNLLVGMGCLVGNVRHAILCDFVVNPEFQHKGIGTAILAKRLEIASELGVKYLYTELSRQNPFREYLTEIGFRETGNNLFMSLGS